MQESQAVAVIDHADQVTAMLVPAGVEKQLKAIKSLQAVIKENLAEKFDYGVIPGTGKPTLLKPGAEKIITIFQARPRFVVVEKIEDWGEKPLFYYHYSCEIVHVGTGAVIGEGEGSCNSKEDKYAYRWVSASELPPHMKGPDGKALTSVPFKWRKSFGKSFPVYKLDNSEVFSLVNTIQKMAMKRAMVAAALVLGRLSDLFTQDLEDIETMNEGDGSSDEPREPETKNAEAPASEESKNTGTGTTTKPENPTNPTPTNGDDFVPVTKAMTDTVTKFIIEHDADVKTSADAFGYIKSQFEGRGIKAKSFGELLANKGNRQALLNFLQEQYGEIPKI